MIAFLEGTLAGKSQTSAYINVGGVGFQVSMATSSLAELPSVGEAVSVLTYMQVRDDGFFLYGFSREEEKALFEKLIAVSGVGPKVALSALSTYAPHKLAELIAAQDVAAIQKIPGVGKKMASRIVLELKGSLDHGIAGLFDSQDALLDASLAAAREALLSMGFTDTEADLALQGAPQGADESTLLQYALKKLGSN